MTTENNVPKASQEYISLVRSKLSALEKLTGAVTDSDGRHDIMNKILIQQSAILLMINDNLNHLVEEDNWTEVVCGRKTVTTAGTAVRLVDERTLAKRIIIIAETDNTGVISVGGTTVRANLSDRQGLPLFAGDSFPFKLNNKNDNYNDLRGIWLDSTVSGDGVTYIYFRAKIE